MLEITIPANEFYIRNKNEFIPTPEKTIKLEHSLVSISKWESKWKKSFLDVKQKSSEEYIDYVKCMTITQNVDPIVYHAITKENMDCIAEYMNDAMTATTVKEKSKGTGREVITAEIIYYWMISLNIPIECQKWHLNRLLTLIKVVNAKQNPKKMSKKEAYAQRKSLNAARRKKLNSKG